MIKIFVVGLMEGQKASSSTTIIYLILIIATRDSTPYFLSEKIDQKKLIFPEVSITLLWEEITNTIILWDFLNYLFLLFKAQ